MKPNATNRRNSITAAEIAKWMTARFRELTGYEDVIVHQPNLLREPDESGCNWAQPYHNSADHEGIRNAFLEVLAEARALFNLRR